MTAYADPMRDADPAAARAAAIADFQRRDAWRRRLPLLPALLFTIVVTQIPFLVNIWFSLQEWTIVPPRGPEFIGLENFTKGILDTGDLIYYFSIIALCLVLSTRALASWKWR